jgi:hypothetical protein
MGDLEGSSGLLKASLNESQRQQMHQNVKCNVIGEKLPARRVSKPSIFFVCISQRFLVRNAD